MNSLKVLIFAYSVRYCSNGSLADELSQVLPGHHNSAKNPLRIISEALEVDFP